VATHMGGAFRLEVRLCLPCEGRWKKLCAVDKDLGRAPWLEDLRRATKREPDPNPRPDPDPDPDPEPEHEELEASEELDEEAEDLWCCCCARCCVTKCMTARHTWPLLFSCPVLYCLFLGFVYRITPVYLFIPSNSFFSVALADVCGS